MQNMPHMYENSLYRTHIQFSPRDNILSAVYAVVVCLSVCLTHSGNVSKRLNLGSRK